MMFTDSIIWLLMSLTSWSYNFLFNNSRCWFLILCWVQHGPFYLFFFFAEGGGQAVTLKDGEGRPSSHLPYRQLESRHVAFQQKYILGLSWQYAFLISGVNMAVVGVTAEQYFARYSPGCGVKTERRGIKSCMKTEGQLITTLRHC